MNNDNNEIKDISDVIKISKPLKAATIELCSQKHGTTNIIVPIVTILQKKNIADCELTHELSIQLKAVILIHCEKRFSAVESVALLGRATILDPRFENIYFKNTVELSKILKYVSDEIKQTQSSCDRSSESDATSMLISSIKCIKLNCILNMYNLRF